MEWSKKWAVMRAAVGAICATAAVALLLGGSVATAWAAEPDTDTEKTFAVEAPAKAAITENIGASVLANDTSSKGLYDGLLVDCIEDYTYAFEVVRLVNIERAKEGLDPLTMDKDLLSAAMKRSREISFKFSHTRPDGTSCFTVSDLAWGENIAIGYSTPAGVVDDWMNSPIHRRNIMNSSFKTIGVGCLDYGPQIFGYWVQLFGTGTATPAKQPANKAVTEKVVVPESYMVSSNFEFRSAYYPLTAGETEQSELRFVNVDEPGFVVELAPSNFVFSIDDPSVATVDSNGVLEGRNAGSTELWASIPGSNVRVSVEVRVSDNSDVGTDGQDSDSDAAAEPIDTAYDGFWQHDSSGWWYAYSGGYATGWANIDGTWYLFDSAGWMLTGWQYVGGSWYYLYGSGAMATGWLDLSGTWYLMDGSGVMLTEWQGIGGTWYYFYGSGAMATGWLDVCGTWYLMDGSGAMLTGWQNVGDTWYYLYGSGAMAADQWVGDYYLTGSGAMAVDTWIGNYYVGADGAWIG